MYQKKNVHVDLEVLKVVVQMTIVVLMIYVLQIPLQNFLVLALTMMNVNLLLVVLIIYVITNQKDCVPVPILMNIVQKDIVVGMERLGQIIHQEIVQMVVAEAQALVVSKVMYLHVQTMIGAAPMVVAHQI